MASQVVGEADGKVNTAAVVRGGHARWGGCEQEPDRGVGEGGHQRINAGAFL